MLHTTALCNNDSHNNSMDSRIKHRNPFPHPVGPAHGHCECITVRNPVISTHALGLGHFVLDLFANTDTASHIIVDIDSVRHFNATHSSILHASPSETATITAAPTSTI